MRCDEITPYLEDLLDGEPDEAAALALDHIAECPECRGRLDWLAASREAFRSLPPERPRNGFDRRLAERIAVETGAEILPDRGEPWRRPLPAWLQRPAVQWAVAASLLLAVLSGSLFLKGTPAGPLLPTGERRAEERPAAPAPAPEIQGQPAAPRAPAPALPREETRTVPSPVRAEPRPVEIRADRGEVRPVPRGTSVKAPAPAPEYLEEDRMAGLDAPPMLGYVQAQDLPVSFRCQLDSTQEGCGLRGTGATQAGATECQGFGECSGASHADRIAAADLTEVASMD